MTIEALAKVLQDLGGYGVAGLMFWFWQRADAERQRYRDNFEKVLSDLPELAAALRGLTDEVARRTNQKSVPPGSE